jgi:hypothetical protein
MSRAALGVAAGALMVATGARARANGRYPQASQIVVDPSDATHWVARSTFGILETRDSGQSWSWTCEEVVGYGMSEDPPVALTADGSTLLAFSGGLRATRDGGCNWAAWQDFGFGIDLTVDPSNPHRALALARAPSMGDAGAFVSLVRTDDDGASFAAVGSPIAGDFVGQTVELGPSADGRVYASGNVQTKGDSGQFIVQPAIERSDDGGQTWTRLLPDLPGAYSLFIGAVDRSHPDVLYARPLGIMNGQLVISRDGGNTFAVILAVTGDLLGFALSPDGSTIAAGGPDAGVYVASTSDLVFRKTSSVGSYCLTWIGSRLLTCAREGAAKFSIGASDDLGAHFTSVMLLSSIAPRACPPSAAGAVCAQTWPAVAAQIQPDGGQVVAPPNGSNPVTDNNASSSHCGCSFRPASAAPFGSLLALAALMRRWRKRAGKARKRDVRRPDPPHVRSANARPFTEWPFRRRP